MAEQCLFYMPDYLYSEGVPIVVVSGRVVRDEKTFQNKLILNLRNISGRVLVSLSMKALLLDESGVIIASQDLFYQNVYAQDNSDFGDKIHFSVPLVNFSNITLMFVGAFFDNGQTLNNDAYLLETVPSPELISVCLKDDNLRNMYRAKFGPDANKVYKTFKDLWICTCGAIHKNDMAFCSACGVSRQKLESFSFEEFIRINDRVKTKSDSATIDSNDNNQEIEYNKGIYLLNNENDYVSLKKAIGIFDKLGNYKDSYSLKKISEKKMEDIVEHNNTVSGNKKAFIAAFIITIVLIASGWFVFSTIKKNKNEEKYEKAEGCYYRKEYEKARDLFEELDEDGFDWSGTGQYINKKLSKPSIKAEEMDHLAKFEESDYYLKSLEYAEKAEKEGYETEVEYDLYEDNYEAKWAVFVKIRINKAYDSKDDYNDAYPYSSDQKKFKEKWQNFCDDYNDEMKEFFNRDRESDIDNKSPNIQWACVINVHWDGSGDDPSGSDEICRFTDGLLGTEVSFY